MQDEAKIMRNSKGNLRTMKNVFIVLDFVVFVLFSSVTFCRSGMFRIKCFEHLTLLIMGRHMLWPHLYPS